MSNFIPNSFQIPNALVDELMGELTAGELKCYLTVVRKTVGWNKEKDAISISQFMKTTKMSRSVVVDSCKSLVEKGLLIKEYGARKISIYSLNLCLPNQSENQTSPKSELVQKSDCTSPETELDLVQKSDTQSNTIKNTTKNIKKTNKKNESDLDALNSDQPQKPVSDPKPKKPKLSKVLLKDFPEDLDLNVWRKWLEFRAEIKKPYKTYNGERNKMVELINCAKQFNTTQAVIAQQSINEEWQGFFEPKTQWAIQQTQSNQFKAGSQGVDYGLPDDYYQQGGMNHVA